MKEIRAYVQPFALGKVVQALLEIPDFPGMTVMDCEGFGYRQVESGQSFNPFLPKKRLEIVAEDHMVDEIVEIIMKRAHSGRPGDGRVFLFEVLEDAKIRTGERRVFHSDD